jgi:alkylhydroperoxidase/carboxymuconolactone decarboxylase family protein YurZ
LRDLVVNDRLLLARLSAPDPAADLGCHLDQKTLALVRVASLVAADGPAETFRWTIGDALDAGADEDEVVGVLLAVASLVGVARVAATAPKVALALDYDLDADLESPPDA